MTPSVTRWLGRSSAVQRFVRCYEPNEQIATVLEGRVRFVVDGDEQVIEPGMTVPLAANVPHEVEALVDSVVLDVFSPVREDWIRGDDAYLRR